MKFGLTRVVWAKQVDSFFYKNTEMMQEG